MNSSLNQLHRIAFWASVIGMFAFIFDFGFSQTYLMQQLIDAFYFLVIALGLFSTFARYIENKTAVSSIHLTPGKYMMECYVRAINGEFHTSHGMWKFITVIDEPTNGSPSEADHTISVSSTANIDSLVHWMNWMNWMNPEGLRTPTPNGFTFLGGMNNCEAGETGYFEADLESGKYLLISETPKADEKGMLKTFTVNAN